MYPESFAPGAPTIAYKEDIGDSGGHICVQWRTTSPASLIATVAPNSSTTTV